MSVCHIDLILARLFNSIRKHFLIQQNHIYQGWEITHLTFLGPSAVFKYHWMNAKHSIVSSNNHDVNHRFTNVSDRKFDFRYRIIVCIQDIVRAMDGSTIVVEEKCHISVSMNSNSNANIIRSFVPFRSFVCI